MEQKVDAFWKLLVSREIEKNLSDSKYGPLPILHYFETLFYFRLIIDISLIFVWKSLVENVPHEMPCTPSPCGLNSKCRELDNHAVCSCLPDMIGAPPNCRPECLVSSECQLDRSCINQKCKNPCENVCGLNARCTVINHNPICSCEFGFTGDPFVRCIKEEQRKKNYRFSNTIEDLYFAWILINFIRLLWIGYT